MHPERRSTVATIENAVSNRRSNVQVSGQGVVVKLLADDNNGSRHQKFIVKLATGNTVLIAHNIDLAPRKNELGEGDFIQFYGEYKWNEKGDVVHWTHKDSNRTHPSGWIRHRGENLSMKSFGVCSYTLLMHSAGSCFVRCGGNLLGMKGII
ncbi:MAG TPA: hypothetical protein DCQ77_12180 [Betaproteobacteria bacterium]|nr:hypothetical protein [Betaproteobacteria bacterium]